MERLKMRQYWFSARVRIRLWSTLVWAGAFALLCIGRSAAQTTADGQADPPVILLQTLHCVEKGNWRLHSYLTKQKELRAAFTAEMGQPGTAHLIVVVRESPSRGHYFDVSRTNDHGLTVFESLSDGGFSTESGNLKFDDPRLFRLGFQKNLERQIQAALQSRTFTIPASEVWYRHADYTCACERRKNCVTP